MASPFLDFFTFLGICITRLNPLVKPPKKKGGPKTSLSLFYFFSYFTSNWSLGRDDTKHWCLRLVMHRY